MKKPNLNLVIVSLFAVLSIPLTLFYTDYAISNQLEVVTRKEQLPLPRVTVQQVSVGDHSGLIEAFGEVKATEELTLLSQASGQVVWKSEQFVVGNKVRKGDLLLRLEDSNYQVELANAKKALADANLALQQEKRKYHRAQKDWKRSEIGEQPSELALRKPQLEIAQAQYKLAKEQVSYAQKNLSHTKIYAPFDGVITARTATLGTYLSPRSSVAKVKSIELAEVKVALSEREWQQLPESLNGVIVTVQSTYNSRQQWHGTVENLALLVDEYNRTRNLTIRVARPLEQETPLLFGRFVKVRLQGKEQKDTFNIPASSVTADGYIWFEQDQKLVKHKVSTLFNSDTYVGVARENLPDLVNLVRKPLSSYVEGMKVAAVMVEDLYAE
ncbi:efflux RND transporter periplasmic adaptor subunit [Photobacterium alginatilyticum]|uniref:efflux RND transporter periplasmic adaptor subunit n=1 Tax=Photobacterium alginatilyticum TaxID=1775171 RepID=UPI0040698BFE